MTYVIMPKKIGNRIFYRVCRIIGDGLPYPLTYHRTFVEAQKAAMERILEVER